MVYKKDYFIEVSNGEGYIKRDAPLGWIRFVWVEGPTDGYTIELYTKKQIVYKFENAPKILAEDNLTIPLIGEIEIKIFGKDGLYKVALGIDEQVITNEAEYLERLK